MSAPAFEERVTRTLEIIRHAIAVGNPIPGTEDLGRRLGVNPGTVRRVLDVLVERRKIKIRLEGRYRFITDRYVGKEQPMGVRVLSSPKFKTRLAKAQKATPAPKRVFKRKTERTIWSEAETRALEDCLGKGLSISEIAETLGRPLCGVSNKVASIRQRELITAKPPEHPGITQWTCQNCNTRSTASLEIGCPKCLPLRKLEAPILEAYERELRASGCQRSMAA